MIYTLPGHGAPAIPLPHFPTRHQAFIFRAYEYVSPERIARVLNTSVENVRHAAAEMGLCETEHETLWLRKGYITIIRRMWHILPYSQLLALLELDEEALAQLLRDEDFLDIKLGKKPICDEVRWRELTDAERARTEEIRRIMEGIDLSGRAPFAFRYSVPKIEHRGEALFRTRMIYAFSGLYQSAFDVDSREYLPDEQLAAYRDLGINGIWTQGVLSRLTAFPFEPSVSDGYEARLSNMRALTERLAEYGIKLYLYINEPRSMPLSFFEKHPALRGHTDGDSACLCTSTEEVRRYLADAIEAICRAVPLIGGFFTITRSENVTNCYSHTGDFGAECGCPRCRERSVAEVVAETVGCIREGARRVSDDIQIFAWSWGWRAFREEIIRRLPKDVILLSQSELDVPYCIGGITGNVVDYSMSIEGPGELARREWAVARECGLSIGAKVQVNTTWEASSVPAIPVSPSVDRHMSRLRDAGVEHLLLSWTLGGYPSHNLAVAAKHFYDRTDAEPDLRYRAAEEQFSNAFREFPFHMNTLYYGPQNAGPSTLLFAEPTGYHATMTCFAYDDLRHWRSVYPEDVFEEQICKLCEGWEKGLRLLPSEEGELAEMAHAAACLFRASRNQIRFVRARDAGRDADAIAAAQDEITVAERMLAMMRRNAAIGYEAANHYYFSKGQLAEKIVNCHYVIDFFKRRQKKTEP